MPPVKRKIAWGMGTKFEIAEKRKSRRKLS